MKTSKELDIAIFSEKISPIPLFFTPTSVPVKI